MQVTLFHSGITDAGQWERELREWPWPATAPDLHTGFELAEPSVLVGSSFGGAVALELAVEKPELVVGLVLVASPLPGAELSPELDAIDQRETELAETGDFEAAAEPMAETWVPGAPEAMRAYVREAQAHTYELPPPTWLPDPDPPVSARLAEVRAPVLLFDGESDRPEFHRIADRLQRELPDVRDRISIAGACHLPNLERPAASDAAVLPFISGFADG